MSTTIRRIEETQVPDDFKCPISLEIMTDPVILSSGHTFDRVSIQRWLDSGHRTCPVSKLPLATCSTLIPNHSLRSLISHFTTTRSDVLNLPNYPHRVPTPLVHELTASLTSRDATGPTIYAALTQLAKLTKSDPGIRREIAVSGAVSAAVLKCVNSRDPGIRRKSLTLLLNLSLDDDSKVGLVAEGAISRVFGVMSDRTGVSDNRAVACTVLTSLAVVEVNKATIGSFPGAIEAMVGLIEEGTGREVKEAATCLYAICAFPGNRVRAVECGAVPVLVRRVVEMERAVEVLSLLVKCRKGKDAMVRVSGLVRVLVGVVRSGSERSAQCALFALDVLCCYSDTICRESITEGLLDACMGLVDDENDNIRSVALCLVNRLAIAQ